MFIYLQYIYEKTKLFSTQPHIKLIPKYLVNFQKIKICFHLFFSLYILVSINLKKLATNIAKMLYLDSNSEAS